MRTELAAESLGGGASRRAGSRSAKGKGTLPARSGTHGSSAATSFEGRDTLLFRLERRPIALGSRR